MAEFAGQWGPEGLEYPNGQHAALASFRVNTTEGDLVPLYTDRDKAVTIPNPGQSDEFGNLSFFAEPGGYVLTVNDMFIFPITVPINPAEDVDLGPVVGRVDALEASDASQNERILILESGGQSPVAIQALIDSTVLVHIEDETPHPAYDDLPSLVALFQNGLA